MQKREYEFDWRFIGDMERGRPNLGNMTRVEVYRLFQYTLRDILERDYGTPEADRLLREAGFLAGRAFAERFIGPCADFGAFVAKVKDALEALRIGILRIEKADVTRLDFILTVAEDLDCSGLPDVGHVVCAYDEGFVAGLFTFFMGRPCSAREVDCWGTGDRTCRFEVRPVEGTA